MNCLDCEHEPPDDRYLCQPCTSRLAGRLAALPRLHRDLARHLEPVQRGPQPVASHGGAAHAPLPVSEDVLDLRGPGGMVHVIEEWRAALYADLDWDAPILAGTYEERLATAVGSLGAHLPWIAEHWPEAGEFATAVRQLHVAAKSIADPEERTIRAGYCTTELEDGSVCGAALRTRLRNPDITCPWCRTSYPASSWINFVVQEAS